MKSLCYNGKSEEEIPMKKPEFFLEPYTIESGKICQNSGNIRFCFLSDLHGMVFGRNNEKLFRAIASFSPDGILVGGDMVIGKKYEAEASIEPALELMRRLGNKYPVWYALGNHEYRMMKNTECYGTTYQVYEEKLKAMGVTLLHNDQAEFQVRGSRFRVYGLELEEEYYRKPKSKPLTCGHMDQLLGSQGTSLEEYRILLAHNPRYGKTYFQWGADLILSGHYHGGLMRLGRRVGLVSPQFHPFPRYCCGDFTRKEQRMIVSAGLGEHTVPIRIHNPRVLIMITLVPRRRGR